MGKENLAGIIMAVCCLGCGVLFFGIGLWADRSEKPVHFWSGTKVDPAAVIDLHGYNHANAVMWKIYSIPYWLSGVFACLAVYREGFMIASVILLCISCFPGFLFLIFRYHAIEKQYIRHERLDKSGHIC